MWSECPLPRHLLEYAAWDVRWLPELARRMGALGDGLSRALSQLQADLGQQQAVHAARQGAPWAAPAGADAAAAAPTPLQRLSRPLVPPLSSFFRPAGQQLLQPAMTFELLLGPGADGQSSCAPSYSLRVRPGHEAGVGGNPAFAAVPEPLSMGSPDQQEGGVGEGLLWVCQAGMAGVRGAGSPSGGAWLTDLLHLAVLRTAAAAAEAGGRAQGS
jgi:hypothetical protein